MPSLKSANIAPPFFSAVVLINTVLLIITSKSPLNATAPAVNSADKSLNTVSLIFVSFEEYIAVAYLA